MPTARVKEANRLLLLVKTPLHADFPSVKNVLLHTYVQQVSYCEHNLAVFSLLNGMVQESGEALQCCIEISTVLTISACLRTKCIVTC